jgi:hypothetical protein
MGRKPISGIEQKIVRAAIAIGGSHDSNVAFSTKEIAARRVFRSSLFSPVSPIGRASFGLA